jgi:hypothetical protein
MGQWARTHAGPTVPLQQPWYYASFFLLERFRLDQGLDAKVDVQ